MNSIFELWKNMDTKFPLDECVIQNQREPEVFDGKEDYLCLIIDKRFYYNEFSLTVATPYIWVGKSTYGNLDNEICYGWVSKATSQSIANFECPIGIMNEIVIGFVKYKKELDNDFLSRFINKKINFK